MINKILFDNIKKQLIIDEGMIARVYICPAGHKTCGIGHLILPTDQEYKYNVGDAVSQQRIDELFINDINISYKGCCKLFAGFETFAIDLQAILLNMIFNLGVGGLSKFKKFIKFVCAKDYKSASKEMLNSAWAKQVGDRAIRLSKKMEALINHSEN